MHLILETEKGKKSRKKSLHVNICVLAERAETNLFFMPSSPELGNAFYFSLPLYGRPFYLLRPGFCVSFFLSFPLNCAKHTPGQMGIVRDKHRRKQDFMALWG